jgi:hypothetical protein
MILVSYDNFPQLYTLPYHFEYRTLYGHSGNLSISQVYFLRLHFTDILYFFKVDILNIPQTISMDLRLWYL